MKYYKDVYGNAGAVSGLMVLKVAPLPEDIVKLAYPVSFNLESELGVETLVSESALVTSYDSKTDKYIVTIPDTSGLNLKVVDRIDADTLNSFTF